MEIYESALVWIPKNSLICKIYTADVSRVPKVILGLSDLWGPAELVMQDGSVVSSVAFSQDGSQVVSGSYDKTVRIWNVTTGEVEAELKGHTNKVTSVAFSQDGSRVVSGSYDRTVRIWNVMTGEVEAELKGHTDEVNSVAFSQDGSQVVSGSDDKTVRIWNVTTGEVEAELKGHTKWVWCVAFSQDGGQVVSGSEDKTVRIWNVTTGEVEAELKGHTGSVMSVAFSQDGSWVVSGSFDNTVRIWNVTTGNSQSITSDIILPDGSRVNRTAPGQFHILYQSQQPMLTMNSSAHLSDDGHWIMANLRDCCIPSQYRNFRCSSVWGSQICLGYDSGHVVIFDMNVAP